MAFDLVYAFMQFNCVTSLSNAHDVCCFLLSDEEQGLGLRQGQGQGLKERDVMSQVIDLPFVRDHSMYIPYTIHMHYHTLSHALSQPLSSTPLHTISYPLSPTYLFQVADTLGVLSDVDLLLARKYDPSSLLDRSDTSCFPEVGGYIA